MELPIGIELDHVAEARNVATGATKLIFEYLTTTNSFVIAETIMLNAPVDEAEHALIYSDDCDLAASLSYLYNDEGTGAVVIESVAPVGVDCAEGRSSGNGECIGNADPAMSGSNRSI